MGEGFDPHDERNEVYIPVRSYNWARWIDDAITIYAGDDILTPQEKVAFARELLDEKVEQNGVTQEESDEFFQVYRFLYGGAEELERKAQRPDSGIGNFVLQSIMGENVHTSREEVESRMRLLATLGMLPDGMNEVVKEHYKK